MILQNKPWIPLSNNTLQVCPYDEDWFAVYMNEGEELDVQATFDNDEGDLDIFLYKEDDLVGAVATGTSIDDNEELSYTATEEAMYYFRVALHNDMGVEEGNIYTLDVNFTGGWTSQKDKNQANPIVMKRKKQKKMVRKMREMINSTNSIQVQKNRVVLTCQRHPIRLFS